MSKVYRQENIKLRAGESEAALVRFAEKRLRGKCGYLRILKKSVDARDKRDVRVVYTIEFAAEKPTERLAALPRLPKEKLPKKPVLVVGSGPAGLFAAIRLVDRGVPVVLVERGAPVEERLKAVERFSEERRLDPECNIQFGEGGAGTFSDGKLNTQTHSALNREVLETFVRFGAPEEILWLNKPHIGSDNLRSVVKRMREYLTERGATVLFRTRLVDLIVKDGRVAGVTLVKGGGEERLDADDVILAIGHSARDTFEALLSRGVAIRQKDFAVGARIEHLQSEISRAQYGDFAAVLPPADYKLVSHASERAAFSFCMCPGGYVMPAASEEGGVVTNGMSNYARDGENANAALVVTVTGKDFGSDAPLAGVEFQRRLERAAFEAGGKTYAAPAQLVGDFLEKRESRAFGAVKPTYGVATAFASLDKVLSEPIADAMRAAIVDMDGKMKGFACPEAVLTGVESRTSSPVRIERGENLQSVSLAGLYPCGEGAGYAGGITSSAADGLRVAERIFEKLNG